MGVDTGLNKAMERYGNKQMDNNEEESIMRKSMLIASFIAAALLLAGASAQAVITFDSIPTPGGFGTLSGLYQGFNWTTDTTPNLLVVTQAAYNGGYGNLVTFPDAGGNAISNNGAETVTLTAAGGGLFVFDNAYLWSWTANPLGAVTPDNGPIARGGVTGGVSAYMVDVMGWVGGVAVYNAEMMPVDFWSVLAGYGGIPNLYALGGFPWTVDKLTFSLDANISPGNAGTYWLMDNVNVSAVPLPPSLYLLGAGFIGILARRRRT